METGKDLASAIAMLAFAVAALHVVYAASGGIAQPQGLAWGLVIGALVGAALAFRASRRGPLWLAWPALLLLWLPVVVTLPAALLSWAGLGVVALLAAMTLGLLWQTLRRATSG